MTCTLMEGYFGGSRDKLGEEGMGSDHNRVLMMLCHCFHVMRASINVQLC